MNGMKEWNNVTIVDEVMNLNTSDGLHFVFCPYVPNGRFIEALDTGHTRWMEADCIFAHQEFYGCAMNAITSVEGDKWKDTFPSVISGHIHAKQQLQENIYYTGSAMQHAFGESSKNVIAMLTFEEGIPYDLEEVDLKLPRKRIVHTTVEDMENYEETETKDKVKITISGVYDQFKAFKKTKKYKALIKKGVKVVFKPKKLQTEKKVSPEVETEQDFKTILSTLINHAKDPYLYQAHEYIVNGKSISEEDVIFLS
jgi:DNA repair exonuclease SbcCD nuclease subunit